jgi:hypothetical protein
VFSTGLIPLQPDGYAILEAYRASVPASMKAVGVDSAGAGLVTLAGMMWQTAAKAIIFVHQSEHAIAPTHFCTRRTCGFASGIRSAKSSASSTPVGLPSARRAGRPALYAANRGSAPYCFESREMRRSELRWRRHRAAARIPHRIIQRPRDLFADGGTCISRAPGDETARGRS